ncbi:MAG: diadenylate cyclase CdaA [Lachnospiraceae bacterium]|nr:diadenylate cyclase CdaA [Clostridiales bacterium]MDD6292986.1 diadenylate cyclase CdaA [Eubacteriales bacterium]MDY2608113.1 diadenylate cyclase CdaA [Lachnospiraceae bacterium]MDY6329628.1 diadenylate cyclase CdaA [Lachnospiraceae bacterium]
MEEVIQNVVSFVERYITIPKVGITDMVEIVIIAALIYEIMIWIKNTRAWTLFKGIVILIVFVLLAAIFNLNTILWIADKTLNVGIIAAIIVFQPELRRALEQLGRKNFINNIFTFDDSKNTNERFSDRTITELVKATYELAKHKTGALIVIEKEISLTEYERTGIAIDAEISNQLLINIFEHNTPLHDGAVIIRGDRIVAATCYLPLSDNMELSKELGTRHRAGVGVSETTDSFTIIVSEETGKVSVAEGGKLIRNVDGENLKSELVTLQNKTVDSKRFKIWKGRKHNEKDINE